MVLRAYSRGRPLNAPATFIHPCQPIVAKQPPAGLGWAHELGRMNICVCESDIKVIAVLSLLGLSRLLR
jgi:hypothetical protein